MFSLGLFLLHPYRESRDKVDNVKFGHVRRKNRDHVVLKTTRLRRNPQRSFYHSTGFDGMLKICVLMFRVGALLAKAIISATSSLGGCSGLRGRGVSMD